MQARSMGLPYWPFWSLDKKSLPSKVDEWFQVEVTGVEWVTKAAVPFRRWRQATAASASEADPSWSWCTMSLSEDSILSGIWICSDPAFDPVELSPCSVPFEAPFTAAQGLFIEAVTFCCPNTAPRLVASRSCCGLQSCHKSIYIEASVGLGWLCSTITLLAPVQPLRP